MHSRISSLHHVIIFDQFPSSRTNLKANVRLLVPQVSAGHGFAQIGIEGDTLLTEKHEIDLIARQDQINDIIYINCCCTHCRSPPVLYHQPGIRPAEFPGTRAYAFSYIQFTPCYNIRPISVVADKFESQCPPTRPPGFSWARICADWDRRGHPFDRKT